MVRFIVALTMTCSFYAAGEDLTMSKKALIFQTDMEERFMLDGQALCKLELPHWKHPFIHYDMPDNAYMTGIYLATQCMRYEVTKDPEAKTQAKAAIRALHRLCTVSGVPGLLSRAIWPKDRPLRDKKGTWYDAADGVNRWRADVSTDQMDGVMYGFSVGYAMIADGEEKKMIAEDAAALADYVLKNNLRIVDVNGKPTQWGNYTPEYVKTEHMNAVLWLQVLKVAHQVSGEPRFDEAYRKYAIDEGYGKLALKARFLLDPTKKKEVNHSDDVLLFLAFEPLLRLEKDEQLRGYYLDGFKRMWLGNDEYPGVKPEANPLYTFLAAKYLNDNSENMAAVNTLRWFPLDMKLFPDTLKKTEQRYGFTYDDTPKSPKPAKGQPNPVDRRVMSWSAWVMDPYHNEVFWEERNREYNGHDYLFGYWLGRYWDYVPKD